MTSALAPALAGMDARLAWRLGVAFVFGLILIVLVLQDAFEVMLLPRRVTRRWRMTVVYYRLTWGFWRVVAKLSPAGARRERFLSIYGPLSLMLLVSLWAATLVLAFGLLHWVAAVSLASTTPRIPLGDEMYLSGVTFFTLGYGDLAPHTALGRVLSVIEAGTGFGLIAVVIGYLPVLYQLFSRREAHVIQLDARAGSPPSAVTMLQRHAESDGLEKLDELLRAWEIWGAELLESHLSYPMLAFYRSQHDDQSWLGALAAILDTCAVILVGVQDVKPVQARMTFAMLRQVVVEIARSLRVAAARSIDPPRLTAEDEEAMLAAFKGANLAWNGGPTAFEILAAVRASYEPLLAGLGEYLIIPVPRWVAESDAVDHWDRGPRGIIARRLIVGLADGSVTTGHPKGWSHSRGLAARLRERLR